MRIFWLACLLAGCGSDDSRSESSTPASPAPWNEDFRSGVIEGCINTSLQNAPTTPKSVAQAYCVCITEELQKKYNEADFKAHASEYSEKIKTDGTDAMCKKRAGL